MKSRGNTTDEEHSEEMTGLPHLENHFLIAMPGMRDERFARAVIYLCAHSEEGAMGGPR